MPGCDWETNATRNPARAPSRSAAKLVSVKWSKNSRGSIGAMVRPPHHSSITAITGAKSDGRSGRILASVVTGRLFLGHLVSPFDG